MTRKQHNRIARAALVRLIGEMAPPLRKPEQPAEVADKEAETEK